MNFDPQEAMLYGDREAIVISNLRFWIVKNKANKKHFYEGKTWTYNSMEAFNKLFYFWPPRRIRTVLDNLIKQGVIIKGNFNKSTYDRTTWYAFKNEEKFIKDIPDNNHLSKSSNGDEPRDLAICQNRQMEMTESANGSDDKVKYKETDIKPYIKPDSSYEKEKEDKNLKGLKEDMSLDDIKKAIKAHFKEKGYKSNVEEFLLYHKENIHDRFKKIDYWASFWEKKYERDIKSNRESSSPNRHVERDDYDMYNIKLAEAKKQYCVDMRGYWLENGMRLKTPNELSEEDVDKIKSRLEND